eukprot:CAMPEP_0115844056 /NCGR_PEP_ID=MMETSP0287-20121206/8634_1 /TAXON_ID=412157 /ORGANISM="Chrysochromulina rotalis, Strain UIO044" /LENGTH=63 /DNA_ID=CAMNT_0003297775 /DNA_START=295 /DNA_END=486 /DNA_ORIENTATION=-
MPTGGSPGNVHTSTTDPELQDTCSFSLSGASSSSARSSSAENCFASSTRQMTSGAHSTRCRLR